MLQNELRRIWLETMLALRVIWSGIKQLGTGGDTTSTGRLYLRKWDMHKQKWQSFGLVSTKVVTDVGVAFIVDAFQNLTEVELFRYHASGTGTTAEAAAQTALVTEVATRTSGTQTEGASANIYRSVGQINYAGTFAITEHGLFSAASGGTLLDRSVFSAINVISGDAIEFTYELTLPAGS